MVSILEDTAGLPVTVLGAGGVLVAEGQRTGKLYILRAGDLEILRDGSVVAVFADPGTIVGEISVLLDQPHSATIRSRRGAGVQVVDDPIPFMDRHPAFARQIARALAERLQRTTALLIDLRARAKEREDREMFDKIFALLK